MILTLGAIGLCCAVLIVATYQGTLPRVERNKARFLERAIFEVLPAARQKRSFEAIDGTLQAPADTASTATRYYAGYDGEGGLVGIAVPAEGQGFQDVLRILYGYSPACRCVIGMKVLESKETPGLGDKIETDPAFRANFTALDVSLDDDGRTIRKPIELVKPRQKTEAWQVEAISGATISSRAIATILRNSTAQAVPVIEANLENLETGARQ